MQLSAQTEQQILKQGIFGSIEIHQYQQQTLIVRDFSKARNRFFQWLGYQLAKNEQRALKKTCDVAHDYFPKLLHFDKQRLCRSFIAGTSLQKNPQTDAAYYQHARQLLDELHQLGIAHNDLEKPENWMVTDDGKAAIIDFQLAMSFKNANGRLFKVAKKEDIRHLYKNKRRYAADTLTDEEKALINKKSKLSRLHRAIIKPIYNFVTRKLLNYSDRENSKFSR